MPDDGFGPDLCNKVQVIKLARDGGIHAPVRANDRDGVVVGVNSVAAAEAAASDEAPKAPPRKRWWSRLLRH
jgi:hypothetical protein